MIIFGPKYVGQTNFFDQKNKSEICLIHNLCLAKIFGPKNYMFKKYWFKKSWANNNFGSKKFLFSKNSEQISGSKKTPYLIRPIDMIQLDTRCFKLT